jgi:Ca2+-binding RTX toxin-like protein
MVQHGSDVALALGNGEVLTLQNVQIGDFTANDFTFDGLNGPPVVVQPFNLPTSGKSTTSILGGINSNLLTGTAGNDSINGGYGADTMQGGADDDIYAVDNAHDAVVEKPGQGIDTVDCRVASYTLPANVENMILKGVAAHNVTGNALANLMIAGYGNDTVNGGGGNDIIKAGFGADVLTGGAGNDMFVFSNVGAERTITDFHIGDDLLDLRPLLASYAGNNPLADGVLAIAADGAGGTLLSADPTHSGTMHELVALQGVTPDMLHIGYDLIW